jgi:hypothetical protein
LITGEQLHRATGIASEASRRAGTAAAAGTGGRVGAGSGLGALA